MSNAKLSKHHSSGNILDNKYKPIDIGIQIEEILKNFKPHLRWYRDKNLKWYIVHAHDKPEFMRTADIILPTAQKTKVEGHKLQTQRKGISQSNKNDHNNYILLKDLINTIDGLYQSTYKDTKIKIIKNLKQELKQQKNQNEQLIKNCKSEQRKIWTKKLTDLEQENIQLKKKYFSAERKLKDKNKELGTDIDNLDKINKDLKRQLNAKNNIKTLRNDENNDNETKKYIEKLKKDCDIFKQEINKLKKQNNAFDEKIKAKDLANIQLQDKNSELKKMIKALKGDTDFTPDIFEEENEEKEIENNEIKTETLPNDLNILHKNNMNKMLPIASAVSESKSMSAMVSLNEFGHKYSAKNLAKCERQQLIDMIVSLYLSNEKFKQELRGHILGVGSENTFLNIDEILNKYVTLRTQTHNNLYNQLLDIFEEKYDDDIDNDNDNDIEQKLEKQSYNILFHILNLSNVTISKEFDDLYMKIAKIIKINKQKHPIKLISNVLHSTLQTYYKQLIEIEMVLNEEEEKEKEKYMFNILGISQMIYDKLLETFSDCDLILKSVEKDVINYIKCCLEMVIIIQLNKPKLDFIHLKEFENIGHEKFDENKHEQCNYDYDEYNESKLQLKQPKYIQYYCFPGLSIENNINIKGKKKKKKKKKGKKENDENKYVIICKTQVVC